MKNSTTVLLFALLPFASALGEPPEPRFEAVTIDDKIQIGYGVAVADVDGDKQPDILLADKKQFVWYRNPGSGAGQADEKAKTPGAWQKFIIAENLTEKDNVCLAAQDIDGDGKCELAVGGEWNPGDTVNSGAVFYMIAPADRTQRWTPVKLHAEPTTHRMRWIKLDSGSSGIRDSGNSNSKRESSSWGLVVVPLHGRGNKNGEGAGVKVLLYRPPTELNDPKGEWKTELIDESMHMTHNFDVARSGGFGVSAERLLLAGREGVHYKSRRRGEWSTDHHSVGPSGVGEVREGELPSRPFVVTVEPMHGNALVVSTFGKEANAVNRRVLTEKLVEGHALGCRDVLDAGSDQIVVGWRGTPGKAGSTHGIHLWTPLDPHGEKWRESVVDDGGMACEDLTLADLDGDGKLDIVAAGRATKNVKVYFNRTGKAQ